MCRTARKPQRNERNPAPSVKVQGLNRPAQERGANSVRALQNISLHHPYLERGDAIVPKRTESKAAKMLKLAGFKSKEVPGIHQVIVSESFRGRQRWSDRMDAAILELTGDPNLVAVIRSAAIDARRDYLIDEMANLAEVSR